MTDDQVDDALGYLDKALKIDETFVPAREMRADIYAIRENYEAAIADYIYLIEKARKTYVYYKLGLAQMQAMKYAEAKESFEQYMATNRAREGMAKQIYDKLIPDCEFAMKAQKNPVPFDAQNLGPQVNVQDMNYFPSISGDGKTLVFTSRNYEGPHKDEDFFVTRKGDESWGPAERLQGALNTRGNEGAQSLSADGKVLFFAACDRPDSRGSCDIYYAFKKPDGMWSEARNIGDSINSRAWESQPSISPDGRTLYFVRGVDARTQKINIMYSTLKADNRWSRAKPIPGKVNTEFTEETPFIHFDNQTLYFSSNGHPGMGGKDLYLSRRQPDGTWGEPENVGYPINSPKDEFGLIVAPDAKTGFFASDREKDRGYMELFSFELPEGKRAIEVAWVRGIISDKQTKQPLEANLTFVDLSTGEVFLNAQSTRDGSYFVVLPANNNYALNVEREGYLFHSENFSLESQTKERAFPLDIELSSIKADEIIRLNNVFFATDKYELKPESKSELDKVVKFLNDNPNVHIRVEGHTDNQGQPAYNKTLSNNRAKSVKEYLVKSGIDAKRLESEGFGETKPIATNETEEGRALNRRTEIRILGAG